MSASGDASVRVVEAAPLRHVVSVPPASPTGGGPRPVLCFLHGYDEGAPVEIRAGVGRHGPLRPGSAPSALRDFVVVAPHLPRAGDDWHRHAADVARIVAEVTEAEGGDPARTYLTGFSFGGNGVFDLGLSHPGTWAALWAVDPTRIPPRPPPAPVWLSVGGIARHGKPAFLRALHLHPAGEDPDGDRLYRDEGHDHVGSATSAYADSRIYAWLLSKRLPSG